MVPLSVPRHSRSSTRSGIITCSIFFLVGTLSLSSNDIPLTSEAFANITSANRSTEDVATPPSTPAVSLASAPKVISTALQSPMQFEPNRGQTDPEVQFMARGLGYTVFLTPSEAVLVLPADEPTLDAHSTVEKTPNKPKPTQVVKLQVLQANPSPMIRGVDETPTTINRLIGPDPAQWQTQVPVYAQVQYDAIYPGIDLLYYGNQQQLEYDFIVQPGADPSAITLGIQGVDHATLEKDGDLLLSLPSGTLRLQKPVLSQTVNGKKTAIPGNFLLLKRDSIESETPPIQVAIAVGDYDPTLPLIIDPLVNYASAFGGEGQDIGEAIAVDNVGHGYIVGTTNSFTFPVTADAFQDSAIGQDQDVFVTKFDTETSEILFSTYIGGEGDDRATGVAVDDQGIPYVTGETTSLTFPTQNPLQETLQGPSDTFVLKLATDGSSLLYSTYLGGSGSDHANSIVVNAEGHASLTGTTGSSNFPTINAIDATLGHGEASPQSDVFVSTLNSQGTALTFSTYLGGAGADIGHSLTLDAEDALYLTGETTEGTGFPVTEGAFQSTYGGGATDAFIAKINPVLAGPAALQYASYLGGSGKEVGLDLLVDKQQQTFITGWTTGRGQAPVVVAPNPAQAPKTPTNTLGRRNSSPIAVSPARGVRSLMRDLIQQQPAPAPSSAPATPLTSPTPLPEFPVTPNAYDPTFNGEKDAFLAQVNAAASGQDGLVYATYMGGSQTDTGTAIGLDSLGRLCIAGTTNSSDYPVQNPLAKQGSLSGGTDAFVTKFQPEPSALLFSSFLGGSGTETITGMHLDANNNAYLTGQTRSTDFPLLIPLDNTTLTGEPQAFVLKIQDPADLTVRLSLPPNSPLQVGRDQIVNVRWRNGGPDDAIEASLTFTFDTNGVGSAKVPILFRSIRNNSGNEIDVIASSCSGSPVNPGLVCFLTPPVVAAQDFSSAQFIVTPVEEGPFGITVQIATRDKIPDTNLTNNRSRISGTVGPEPPVSLTVDFQGNGTGDVQVIRTDTLQATTISKDTALDFRNGTSLILVATPTSSGSGASTFSAFSGCDRILRGQCNIQLNDSRTVTATFVRNNEPPSVNAGPDQTITLPASASLNGTVTDDGLPGRILVNTSWSRVSGPGPVFFANSLAVDTTAAFRDPGTYVLRLTANDGALSRANDVSITVEPANQPPNGVIDMPSTNQTISGGESLTFAGTATDPDNTTPFTHRWTFFTDQTSGTVSGIRDSSAADPGSRTFNNSGTFRVTYTVTDADGLADPTPATVDITVVSNQRPVVVAGPDQSIILPNSATLNGTVTDDGLPASRRLTTSWSRVSGPGTVTFANAAAVDTTATFSAPGTHVLRLTANDGVLSGSDDVTISVGRDNQAPSANAGPDQNITLPAGATLNGTVSDDGLPAGAALTTQWSRISGPGTVTFANAATVNTTATFSAPGTHVLRLTANDGVLSGSDDVTISVGRDNQAPSANAGPDQNITLPAGATLNGTVSDDGLPAGAALTTQWSRISGPGTATFANTAAVNTTATLSAPGTHVLRLTANDGALSGSDDVTITVAPIQRTLTVTPNPNGTVSGGNISCGSSCEQTVSNGTSITLRAIPNPGFTFSGLTVTGTPTATCPGTGTCTIPINTNRTVTAAFAAIINQAPTVEAGPDQVITLPDDAPLNGTVGDDGLPAGATVTTSWTPVSGPGTVTFANAGAVDTMATFSEAGAYVLRLSATDSAESASDTLAITVNPIATPMVIVPNVVGLTRTEATTALGTDLVVGTITEQTDLTVPEGTVIAQDPAANSTVSFGSAVSLLLASSGQLLVTNPDDAPDATPGDGVCDIGTGACTLRAAIQEANAFAGEQTIVLPSDTYTLTLAGANEDAGATGDLDITGDVIIERNTSNAGDVVISGNTLDRVFDLPPGSTPRVTLRGLTIQQGQIVGSTGGGIRNTQGALTIEDSLITANRSNGSGGGISHLGGTLTLRETQVTNNISQGLGGGLQAQNGTVTIDGNTQFTGNTANFGGGLSVGRANVTVTNTLVENNTAVGVGGGIYKFLSLSDLLNRSPTFDVELSNTTVRNNMPNNCEGNISGCQ